MNSTSALAPLLKRRFTREAFPQTTFVYLVAPTCFGKGYLIKLLRQWTDLLVKLNMLNMGVVSFGELIRHRLATDEAFRKEYGSLVAGGALLPDDVAMILFDKAIDEMVEQGMPNIVIVDGFCRSPEQIGFASQMGYLAEGDHVIMLEASEMKCFERFAHRCTHKPDGKQRLDAESDTFMKRYHMHQGMAPQLRELFKESACAFHEIKNDGDIADDILPMVKEIIQPSMLSAVKAEKHEPVE